MTLSSPDSALIYTETLTFVERRSEYPGVATYIFRPAQPIQFEAGQYAHIRMLNMPEGTRRVHELSFASSPQDANLWFGVDGRSGSNYQQSLQSLQPGDLAELFKIRGHMTWPPLVSDVVMIAGGVGVTPFRSMILDAHERTLPITIALVHVSSSEFLYADALRDLVHEYVTINRSLLTGTIELMATEHPNAHYYVAGSENFVVAVSNELTAHGITRIESDEFKGLLAE